MRRLDELNMNEGGEPVSRPPPTKDTVAEYEARYGVSLPEDYLAFLRHSNGGHPELDTIITVDQSGTSRWSIDYFYYLNDDVHAYGSLWAQSEVWRPVLGSMAVPIAGDGLGNVIYLCLEAAPPSVRICLHDRCNVTVVIAPSFEAFIDRLVTHTGDE